MPSVTPDKWMSDVFILITLWIDSEPVHPAMFEAQARRHWEERLRQRVEGKALADLADSRDRAIELADNQRKEYARDIKRRAESLNAHLAAHQIDTFVPANWPTKDGVTQSQHRTKRGTKSSLIQRPARKRRSLSKRRSNARSGGTVGGGTFWNGPRAISIARRHSGCFIYIAASSCRRRGCNVC